MLNKNIVFGMILRYFYGWRHDYARLTDSFYWPAIDIFLWGLTSVYIKNASTEIPQIVFVILTGVVFWSVIWRSQYEISTNLLAEFWDKNLVNIFASPLRISEWIAAVMTIGTIKMLMTLVFAAFLSCILYAFNVFLYGSLLIPFVISLLITGWSLGFLVAGIIIRFGQTLETLAWAGPVVIAPFAGFYYPIATLPIWAQKIAVFVPPSYIFEGMREILFTGSFSPDKLVISFALNGLYMVLSIMFFVFMFNQSRKLGLGRLI